jgi:ubiquinone/menaquinone biosynthesis C-methylase UbiE
MDADGPNADQIEFWNNEGGAHLINYQTALNSMLDQFGHAVMDQIGVHAGEAALDIGCGCGDSTIELARRVGPKGKAVGVDISETMLVRAEVLATHAEVTNAFFEPVDVETGRLHKNSFDLAFSRFGIMFFANPSVAFANIYDALHDGGRIGFACWQPVTSNAWINLQVAAIAPLLETVQPPSPPDPLAPGPFSLGDPARITELLGAAGFEQIEIKALAPEIALFGLRELDEVVDFAMEIGPGSNLLDGQSDAVRDRARQAVCSAYSPYASDDGVVMQTSAWIVFAQKPG